MEPSNLKPISEVSLFQSFHNDIQQASEVLERTMVISKTLQTPKTYIEMGKNWVGSAWSKTDPVRELISNSNRVVKNISDHIEQLKEGKFDISTYLKVIELCRDNIMSIVKEEKKLYSFVDETHKKELNEVILKFQHQKKTLDKAIDDSNSKEEKKVEPIEVKPQLSENDVNMRLNKLDINELKCLCQVLFSPKSSTEVEELLRSKQIKGAVQTSVLKMLKEHQNLDKSTKEKYAALIHELNLNDFIPSLAENIHYRIIWSKVKL